jgi:hypothetical protein
MASLAARQGFPKIKIQINKTMKTSSPVPPTASQEKSTRALRRVTHRTSKKAINLRGATPGKGRQGTALTADPALPAATQGSIRMDVTNLSPAALLSLVQTIKDGLTGNMYYPGFTTEIGLLGGSETGLSALLSTLASLEQQRKTIRAALDTEIAGAQNNLRSVGLACENYDRTDEALVSAGWTLRRMPGPAQPVSTPTRLVGEPSAFAGQLRLRWGRVANSRYHELQSIPTEDLIDNDSWNAVPIVACPRTQFDLTGYASGRLVSIRVRAYGSRGAGPWCASLNTRIS